MVIGDQYQTLYFNNIIYYNTVNMDLSNELMPFHNVLFRLHCHLQRDINWQSGWELDVLNKNVLTWSNLKISCIYSMGWTYILFCFVNVFTTCQATFVFSLYHRDVEEVRTGAGRAEKLSCGLWQSMAAPANSNC